MIEAVFRLKLTGTQLIKGEGQLNTIKRMRRLYITAISFILLAAQANYTWAQYNPDTTRSERVDVYRTRNMIDIPVTVLGIGGTLYGFHLRENKSDSDSMEIMKLDASQLPRMDRKVTTYNSPEASMISDVMFAEGFVLPWFLFADKKVRGEAYDYSIMYLEAMGITGTGYAMAAGLVYKYRPYAYNPDVDLKRRMNKHSRNSFYAGHVAVTAAGTFFAAKVYNDYHPDSRFRYVMWGIAGASTLGQCYARYKGGYHFASDIAIGAGLGTAAGILVPVIHKREKQGSALTLDPWLGEVPGITLRYTFRENKISNAYADEK
jgi:hypothetical protein